jgi:salicylate hydroxylase
MNKAEFIIVGGGIAGLAAAIAVAPRETILLEQATEWTDAGAGLQLGPNAVRALQKLGTWDAVAPITSSPPEIHIHDGVSGKLLKRLTLGASFEKRFGAPYRVAHRADLHRALLSVATALPNLNIRLAQTASNFDQTETAISITTNKGTFHAGKLLAADGVKSPIRQKLFANSEPRSTGEVYHRALLPVATQASGVALDCVNLWLYPKGHVVHYPVGTAQHLNLVAITPELQSPATFFAKSCQALQNIINLPRKWTVWPSLYVKPLSRTNANRILLIGDAAHGTVPYLAQGAAMALEDAAALELSPIDFAAVSARCAPRTRRLHNASMQQARIYHAGGLAKSASQLVLQNLPESYAWSRLSWLYKA